MLICTWRWNWRWRWWCDGAMVYAHNVRIRVMCDMVYKWRKIPLINREKRRFFFIRIVVIFQTAAAAATPTTKSGTLWIDHTRAYVDI